EMIVEIDAEHVRPGSPRAHRTACSRHVLSVPDAANSPVSVVLAVPFAFRLPVAGARPSAGARAFSLAVTGVGTGRVGRRDGRAEVRVGSGWPPLGHRSGRGHLPGTRSGTTGRRGRGGAAGGRAAGVTASAAAV